MRYKAIIFDCFGTLVAEVGTIWFAQLSAEQIRQIRDRYLDPSDKGDVSEEELFIGMGQIAAMAPGKIRDEWIRLAQVNDGIASIVEQLSKHYKLAILSDSPAPFFHEVIENSKLQSFFSEIFVSAEARITKAELGAYERALKKLGVPAEETIMTDDDPANIERARLVGITGFVFEGSEKLKGDLAGAGIELG